MQPTTVPRRYFLKGAVAGAVGIVLGQPGTSRATDAGLLKIEQPFHGAVLNHRHGRPTADGLTIQVAGSAPLGDRVTVGGQPAKRTGTAFSAEVLLREHETDIVAVCEGSQRRGEHRVRVVWDKHSEPRYRFAIDDNVFFLRDIAKKGYKSIFECFYLGMLRRLHHAYGTKFALNTKVDLVCNHLSSIDQVIPTLEPLAKDPDQAEIMDLTSHEQPFWPFWQGHLPDHEKRLEAAIRWVTEHGYKPVFFHEGFIGGRG